MKVEIEQQVLHFVRTLAPEPRRALRESLKKLALEKGDIRALEGDLEGFYRLRVGRYRVVVFYRSEDRTRRICCVYAAHRTIIYGVFAQQLHELLHP